MRPEGFTRQHRFQVNRIGRTLVAFLVIPLSSASRAAEPARARQGSIDLPTYVLGEEDPNPPFPLVAGHNIYPYTLLDDLTDRVETKSYRAIFLENKFLKAIVLPEMGGRLYSLFDKVSGREVFYRNHVVKYGLVALRGAWISGGIEFNFPDGHTVVTVSPVASTFFESPDGSATAVVGEVDRVTGMHWEVALTLRPDAARLEQRVTLFNGTPTTHPYWYWANAAVPATDDMQFVYPMREAYPHARWPVYTYPDYQGVDYSWYKNIRRPTSLFGRQVHRNFFGAIYHNADWGVVHAADYREVPGKKIWSWGTAGDGLIWTGLLTDRDGPYNEIQSGRYETQLNYEFMPPRKVESWTEYWYPVRGLGGAWVEATADLALNFRSAGDSNGGKREYQVSLCAAVPLENVKIRVVSSGRALREFAPVTLEPLEPQAFRIPAEGSEAGPRGDANVGIEITAADRSLLARWSSAEPVDGNPDFVPAANLPKPRLKPEAEESVEELYFRGVETEKAGKADDAAEIFQQVLGRDASHLPALNKLAWRSYRAGDFETALGLLLRALARDAHDARTNYTAGIVANAAGRSSLAKDYLWTAVHFGDSPAAAYAALGEIAIEEKTYDQAAALLRKSLGYNRDDALALAELAVALRLGGKVDDAVKAADAALQKMPLLPFALAERARLAGGESGKEGPAARWTESLRSDDETALEIASWYLGLHDLDSAARVLRTRRGASSVESCSPLVGYYLADVYDQMGQSDRAANTRRGAASGSLDKVFPSGLTDMRVLADAIARSPADSHARYLLGNVYFARGRYHEAARLWAEARDEGLKYSVLERNLGVYAWRVKKDLTEAAQHYSEAIKLVPADYRLYVDLDRIYFALGDTRRREEVLRSAPLEVLVRDAVRVRRALLLVQQKRYEGALEVLSNHNFKPWEGGELVRQMYVAANLELGRKTLKVGDARGAEAAFRRAAEYPEPLGVGKPAEPHDEEALYWLGTALQAGDRAQEASEAWKEASAEGKNAAGTSLLFAALAREKLGEAGAASAALRSIREIAASPTTGPYDLYVAGLAESFEGRVTGARDDFRRALEKDPALWQARLELDRVESEKR